MELIWRGVVIGIGATVLIDLWAVLLWRAFGQARPNWAPVGRWFFHLKNGTVFHDDIAAASPYRHELALGWAGHYAVGIVYGVLLALLVGRDWFATPTFLPAWILGIVTVGAGWFLLQPGLGLGWAASKLPHRNRVRVLNLVSHTVFAIGLYGTALLIR
ncbi:DUF2938 domain-containing protein [Rhizobium sp. TRM95111]|uniref:DUF2938 domain-containing protein n=1 Tax=Rhizobium alarense TaxID=2846851 RepID=UPI001F1AE2EE|nr:DUF2938 domain-containing protein [Rhizobium alarense]MCF3642424.1 DUF2938 domain-containing protein [Rhizobium alarense]